MNVENDDGQREEDDVEGDDAAHRQGHLDREGKLRNRIGEHHMVRERGGEADKYRVLEIEPEQKDADQRCCRIEQHLAQQIESNQFQVGSAEITGDKNADENGRRGDPGDKLQDRSRLVPGKDVAARQPEPKEKHQRDGKDRGQEIVQNVGQFATSSQRAQEDTGNRQSVV